MEKYTKEMITWAKHLDVVTFRKKVGYLPGYIVLKLCQDCNDELELRINVGFSTDRKRLYIKLSDRGAKLSDVGDGRSRLAKTFGIHAILNQFTEKILGRYTLIEDVEFEDGILIFEKIED